ncbi:MAG: hypothetical protein R3F30_04450 [Planctomycetota bacterium]
MDFELQDAEFLPDAGTLVTRDPDGLDVGREIELHRQGMAARSQGLFPVGDPWEVPQPWSEPGRKGQVLDNLFSVGEPWETSLPWDMPSSPTLGRKGQELGDLFPVPEPWAEPLPWVAPPKVGCCSGCASGKTCEGDGFEADDGEFELGPILDRVFAGSGGGSGQTPLPPPPIEPELVFSVPVLDTGIPVGGITVEQTPPTDIPPFENDVCCCCVEDIKISTITHTTAGHRFSVTLESSATRVKGESNFNCHYDWQEKKISKRSYPLWRAAESYHRERPEEGFMKGGWVDMVKTGIQYYKNKNREAPKDHPSRVFQEMNQWCDPEEWATDKTAEDDPHVANLPGAKRVLIIYIKGQSGGCELPCKCEIDAIMIYIRQELSVSSTEGKPAFRKLDIDKVKFLCDGSFTIEKLHRSEGGERD